MASVLSGGPLSSTAVSGYEELPEQLRRMKGEHDLGSKSGDPNELLEEEKGLQNSEYSGTAGLLRYGIHKLYGQFSSDQDPDKAEKEYEEAIRTSKDAVRRNSYIAQADKNKNDFLALAQTLTDASNVSQAPNDMERQKQVAEQQHRNTLARIQQFGNNPYSSYNGLFKDQAAEDNAIKQLTLDANIVLDRAEGRSGDPEVLRKQTDAERMEAAHLEAAGNIPAARRQALLAGFNAEERSLDPNDNDERGRLTNLHKQQLANFDAEAARQSKSQAAQSNDRIAGLHEEAQGAQLRAAGKNDEASLSALNFSTQQRVRSLQEQADAEGDSTKKAQLLQEVAAATEAGKVERDAMQKELQRKNTQTPPLTGSSSKPPASDSAAHNNASPGNLVDVSKRLDDAAGKLERAVTNLRSMSILKD